MASSKLTTIDLTNDEEGNEFKSVIDKPTTTQKAPLLKVFPKPRAPNDPQTTQTSVRGAPTNSREISVKQHALQNPRKTPLNHQAELSKYASGMLQSQAIKSCSHSIDKRKALMVQSSATTNLTNKQQSRQAFRIFVRQNYHFVRRMLGKQYSKDNLRDAFSKWWNRMIPAGRRVYVEKTRAIVVLSKNVEKTIV